MFSVVGRRSYLSDLPCDPEQLKGKLIELASAAEEAAAAAEEAAAQRDAALAEIESFDPG